MAAAAAVGLVSVEAGVVDGVVATDASVLGGRGMTTETDGSFGRGLSAAAVVAAGLAGVGFGLGLATAVGLPASCAGVFWLVAAAAVVIGAGVLPLAASGGLGLGFGLGATFFAIGAVAGFATGAGTTGAGSTTSTGGGVKRFNWLWQADDAMPTNSIAGSSRRLRRG